MKGVLKMEDVAFKMSPAGHPESQPEVLIFVGKDLRAK